MKNGQRTIPISTLDLLEEMSDSGSDEAEDKSPSTKKQKLEPPASPKKED